MTNINFSDAMEFGHEEMSEREESITRREMHHMTAVLPQNPSHRLQQDNHSESENITIDLAWAHDSIELGDMPARLRRVADKIVQCSPVLLLDWAIPHQIFDGLIGTATALVQPLERVFADLHVDRDCIPSNLPREISYLAIDDSSGSELPHNIPLDILS